MKRLLPGIVTLCIALSLSPSLAGQVVGLPVYNAGIPTGIGVYGDVGFPNDAAGDGIAYGAMGRLGSGAFGATASIVRFNPEGSEDSFTGLGGTLNYKVFGGPLVPLSVTLQGGVGYAKQNDTKLYHYPVGLGFALTIPNPSLAIKPWLAPRLDIARLSNPVGSDTETNFGLSGGVEFNFLSGFGLHAAYDRVFVDSDDPSTFAAGLHYTFRVPGL